MTDLTAIAQQLAALTESLATLSGDQTPTPNPTPSTTKPYLTDAAKQYWSKILEDAAKQDLYSVYTQIYSDYTSMLYALGNVVKNARFAYGLSENRIAYAVDQSQKRPNEGTQAENTSPYRDKDWVAETTKLSQKQREHAVLGACASLAIDKLIWDIDADPDCRDDYEQDLIYKALKYDGVVESQHIAAYFEDPDFEKQRVIYNEKKAAKRKAEEAERKKDYKLYKYASV